MTAWSYTGSQCDDVRRERVREGTTWQLEFWDTSLLDMQYIVLKHKKELKGQEYGQYLFIISKEYRILRKIRLGEKEK